MYDDRLSESRAGRLFVRRRRELFDAGELFIAVSEFIRQRLLDLGAPPERTILHYIGVRTDIPVVDRAFDRTSRLLFVGRLVPKKGLDSLILALSLIDPRIRPHLDVIGDGPMRDELMRLATVRDVSATFYGSEPHAKVLHRMRGSFALCLPSRRSHDGDAEGLGLVILEAQARGTPVIATRSGGIPEVIEHGRTGLMAEPGDASSIANCIFMLLDDSRLRRSISDIALRQVVDRFDSTKQGAILAGIYDSVAQP